MDDRNACTRRAFLYRASLFAGATAVSTLLPPKEASALPSEEVSALSVLPVLTWLGRFAAGIASNVISSSIIAWLNRNDSAAQAPGRSARTDLTQRGHDDFSRANVWQTNNFYFYGATNTHLNQAYAPFIYPVGRSSYSYTLLGGPAIMALPSMLSRLILAYPRSAVSDLAQILIPANAVNSSSPFFPFSASWWASYYTNMGYVEMRYTAQTPPYYDRRGNLLATGKGQIYTVARNTAHEVYAARREPISYI